MSSRNGDKARFGRQRKQKIARRLVLRGLREQKPAAASGQPEAAPQAVAPQA